MEKNTEINASKDPKTTISFAGENKPLYKDILDTSKKMGIGFPDFIRMACKRAVREFKAGKLSFSDL